MTILSDGAEVTTTSLTVQITSMSLVAERVVALELSPLDGQPLPQWHPGAHIDVTLTDGLVRQYSLCSHPGASTWRVAVLEETDGRGGSQHVHRWLQVGDLLRVSAPRNNFELELRGRPLVFVAGGIGVTPILAMVHAAAAADLDWRLAKLSRSPEASVFDDELTVYGDRVHHHHDSVDGQIDLVDLLDSLGADQADVYACGPAGLLLALEEYAAEHPGCSLRLERFSGKAQPTGGPEDHAFVVETADGTEVSVAADQTILEALTKAGIPMLSSCQEGICGTCETTVLAGVPDHRDQLLSAEERASGEMLMPCVSRCVGSRIALDL